MPLAEIGDYLDWLDALPRESDDEDRSAEQGDCAPSP
jgi:hypothetical protein